MANSITAAKHYAPVLDTAYEASSLTSVLNIAPEFVRSGRNAGEFLIAKQTLVGLGTYSKTAGYPAGDVTLAWETHSYSYDRGRKFSVDNMDNLESAGQAFGALAAEFLRTKVVPEVDAIRLAGLAQAAGTDTYGTLSSSANWLAAIDTAMASLGDAGVPRENLVMFISYTGENYLKNSTANARYTRPGENPDRRFGMWDGVTIIPVPANRFYTKVAVNAGASASTGGYASQGDAMNFILMDKSAAFVDAKHAEPRLWSPNGENGLPVNPDANSWRFDYRIYHDIFVPDNKAEGIYAHSVTEIS